MEHLKNLPSVTDWHANGLYVVVDAAGAPFNNTLADTAYSARSNHAIDNNLKWRQATAKGHMLLKLSPSASLVETSPDLEPSTDHELDVTAFDVPSGNVRGFMTLSVKHRKKHYQLGHALFLTNADPDLTVKFPSRMTPAELTRYTAALMLFQERVLQGL